MTVAPHRSPARRLALTAGCAVLLLVLGVLAQREYGLGPALFLYALAAVAAVDAVQVQRRAARRKGAASS